MARLIDRARNDLKCVEGPLQPTTFPKKKKKDFVYLRVTFKVQNRAARFVTGNYNFETGILTGTLEHLKWEPLKKRRRDTKV